MARVSIGTRACNGHLGSSRGAILAFSWRLSQARCGAVPSES